MIPYMQDDAKIYAPTVTKDAGGNQRVEYNSSGDIIKVRRSPASGNVIREVDGAAYNPTEYINATSNDIDIKYKLYFAIDNVWLFIINKKEIKRGNIFSHYEYEGVRVDR